MPIFLWLLWVTTPSHAAVPLAWDEVRMLAREKSPELASAHSSWRASHSAVNEVYGSFLPKLALNANRTRALSETATTETRKTDLGYGATASWNLFSGFSSLASLRYAKAAELESEANFQLTSANLRHDLRVAYFNIFVWQERLRLNELDLKRVQQNHKLMEIKYDNGSEARWNLKTTKADLDRALYNVSSAKLQLKNAREALAALLYLDSLPEDRPVEPLDPSRLPAEIKDTVAEHPELRKSRFAGERAEADVTTAKSGFYPSLDLSFTRSHLDSLPDGAATSKTNSSAFAISASWNLFNGAIDYYKLQSANLTFEAAELSTASTERRLLSSLRSKEGNYRSFLDQLPVTKAAREAAEERERTVSEQYRSGLKTYLDWEQAEKQLLDAEQSEIKALGDSLNAFADLELALGLTLEQP